jgi:hypothetical protein
MNRFTYVTHGMPTHPLESLALEICRIDLSFETCALESTARVGENMVALFADKGEFHHQLLRCEPSRFRRCYICVPEWAFSTPHQIALNANYAFGEIRRNEEMRRRLANALYNANRYLNARLRKPVEADSHRPYATAW